MKWKLLKAGSPDFVLGASRTHGFCACGVKGNEVVAYENRHLRAFCSPCRQRLLGLTSEERRHVRETQEELFK